MKSSVFIFVKSPDHLKMLRLLSEFYVIEFFGDKLPVTVWIRNPDAVEDAAREIGEATTNNDWSLKDIEYLGRVSYQQLQARSLAWLIERTHPVEPADYRLVFDLSDDGYVPATGIVDFTTKKEPTIVELEELEEEEELEDL